MSEIKEKTSFEENRTPSSRSNNEVALEHTYEETEVKRVVHKIDWNLLPLVTLLYLLSFLDRANIGNARVAGMAVDVQLTGLKYNVVAAVFFIPYALAEVPSNILLKLIRPSRWIPSIMVAWGLVMTLMCLCNTYEGLIIARCFLGLTEAGLFPGVTFYLSMWYRRRDVAFRIAIFFSAATLAGAFGGLLAYAIDKMDGIGGLHGWQWIFCLEGMLTVLVAFGAFFWMHDYPATAKFLTEHEKTLILDVLKADTNGQATGYSKDYVWQAFKDYKTYVAVVLYMGILIPVYAISLFLPTIVNQLGYAPATSQLLTIPPFVLGCIMTVTLGYLSDKYQRRGPFVIFGCSLAMVGYLILYNTSTPGPGYAGAVLAAMGVFPTVAVDLAWAGSMAGGDVRKGVVLAMVIGLGNLGGVCSSFIYIKPPRFHTGHGTIMGWLGLTIILSAFSMWDYNRRNKAKIAQCEREGIDASQWAKYKDMGSESPLFRYTL